MTSDSQRLPEAWHDHWGKALLSEDVSTPAQWDARWQELRESAHILGWSAENGQMRYIVASGPGEAWLTPGARVGLAQDTWTHLLHATRVATQDSER